MTLKDLESLLHNDLDVLYGKEEVSSFFVLIIEHYYKITRLQLALEPNMSITKEEQVVFFEALKHLKAEKPIQYILGETEFYGLPFKVNENTLIPRPETEELVEWVIASLENRIQNLEKIKEKNKAITILDIGTGSGCIAISLAKNVPNARVYALDVSSKALTVAKQNAELNNVSINFVETDILESEKRYLEFNNLEFDVIVSNPPYVRNREKVEMQANVLNNEPHLALFVENENPLLFYKKITEFAEEKLCNGGELFFEINEYLGKETLKLMEDRNFIDVELKKDIFGKDRLLKGRRIENKI